MWLPPVLGSHGTEWPDGTSGCHCHSLHDVWLTRKLHEASSFWEAHPQRAGLQTQREDGFSSREVQIAVISQQVVPKIGQLGTHSRLPSPGRARLPALQWGYRPYGLAFAHRYQFAVPAASGPSNWGSVPPHGASGFLSTKQGEENDT